MPAASRRPRPRAIAAALGVAIGAHAVAIGGYRLAWEPSHRLPWWRAAAVTPAEPARVDDAPAVAAVELVEVAAAVDARGAWLVPEARGPGDVAGFAHQSPLPGASADLPGRTAADRGGGDVGGVTTWTGRRDDGEVPLRSQPWSDPDRYRAPRPDTDRAAASPEAISRSPDRTYGDRQVRARARDGEAAARPGEAAAGAGAGAADALAWQDADPVFDAAAGRAAAARADGATRRSDEATMLDEGEAAVDVQRRGAAGDRAAVAAASDQRQPDPYDLTPARAGGKAGEGVRGARAADGAVADGRGRGTGASRADLDEGDGGAATWASRTDPYLRELMRKLDREVEFPRDLALDLRSGRPIAMLTLHADGRMTDVTIVTTSGFAGFDAELARALRAVGKLGPAPAALLDGKRSLRVMVPYTFKNPVVQ
jgi:TonB family protein